MRMMNQMNSRKAKFKRKCDGCQNYFLVYEGYSSNRSYCDKCRRIIKEPDIIKSNRMTISQS